MLLYLLQGLILGLSAAATPGPFQAFLLSQSAQRGWRRTLPAACAPLVSDGPIIVLVMFVLTQMPAGLVEALRIGGGLFLLYLAQKALGAARQGIDAGTAPPEKAASSLLQAVMLNILNPNPYIFWSLIGGPVLLQAWQQAPWYCLSFLGGMYAALIGGCACLVILFATAALLGAAVNRALLFLSAAALALYGSYQLFAALSIIVRRFS
jgi:threonine/homoserine/homoserine lactone efflux protein